MNFQISTFEEYEQAYASAMLEPDKFWAAIADNFSWFQRWSEVYNYDFKEAKTEWFKNAKLNITINCLDRHAATTPDKIALNWESNFPTEPNRVFTYAQLLDKVCQTANALRLIGINKSDRVCIYMPMVPELMITVLACARIGAIHSVVFAGFSANALAERLQDATAHTLITANIGYRGDKIINILEIATAAAQKSASVQNLVVFNRAIFNQKEKKPTSNHTTPLISTEKLKFYDFDTLINSQKTNCEAEIMDAEDPLFILYTSGSTGKPKGVVHSCAGYMVYTAYTFANVFQCQTNDIFFCTADIGWITGHSYMVYGGLLNGISQVMFEGIPTYPNPSRFWDIVDKYKVSHFYTAPTAIRALMAFGETPFASNRLDSLKVLGSVGEPLNEEAWHWYNEYIGRDSCPIVDTWWQTETGGVMISTLAGVTFSKPAWAGLPLVGVQLAIMDENGQEIHTNEADGALCLRFPVPSLIRTTYGDHQRCKNAYFSTFPNYYFTGDRAKRDENGLYRIIGRMDDVLNVSGHRIGTAELENVINQHIYIIESAVVGFAHPIKGEAIAAFVIANTQIDDEKELFYEIQYIINKEISAIAKIDKLFVVPNLPKTRSGKIMRRILKKLLANESDLGDISTLLNPEIVAEIKKMLKKSV
jgi:acetyl-CoA synthetase